MKQERTLKKKIFAAAALFLSACVVMVSATYAWLVLSISPEAKEVTTVVGGNGSLEIALATPEHLAELVGNDMYDKGGYTLTTGDPVVDNTMWGNLLDLSDPSYGLQELKLKPATMNVVGNVIQQNPILTAMYGVDGRITTLSRYSTTAAYDRVSGSYTVSDVIPYGVRVAGVSSNAKLMNRIQELCGITLTSAEALMQDYSELITAALYTGQAQNALYNTATLREFVNEFTGIPADEEAGTEAVPGLKDQVTDAVAAMEQAFTTVVGENEQSALREAHALYKAITESIDAMDAQLASLEPTQEGAAPVNLSLSQVQSLLSHVLGSLQDGDIQFWHEVEKYTGEGYAFVWERLEANERPTDESVLAVLVGQNNVFSYLALLSGNFSSVLDNVTWLTNMDFTSTVERLGGESMEATYNEKYAELQAAWNEMGVHEFNVGELTQQIHEQVQYFFYQHTLGFNRTGNQSATESKGDYKESYLRDIEEYLHELDNYLYVIEDFQKLAVQAYASSGILGAKTYQQVNTLAEGEALRVYLQTAGLDTNENLAICDVLQEKHIQIWNIIADIDALIQTRREDLAKGETIMGNFGQKLPKYDSNQPYTYEDVLAIWTQIVDLDAMTVENITIHSFANYDTEVLVDSLDRVELENDYSLLYNMVLLSGKDDYQVTLTDRISQGESNSLLSQMDSTHLRFLRGNVITVQTPEVSHYHADEDQWYDHGYVYRLLEHIVQTAPNQTSQLWAEALAKAQAAVAEFEDLADTTMNSPVWVEFILEDALNVDSVTSRGFNGTYIAEIKSLLQESSAAVENCESALQYLLRLYAAGQISDETDTDSPEMEQYDLLNRYIESGLSLLTLKELADQLDFDAEALDMALDSYDLAVDALAGAQEGYDAFTAAMAVYVSDSALTNCLKYFANVFQDSIVNSSITTNIPSSLAVDIYRLFVDTERLLDTLSTDYTYWPAETTWDDYAAGTTTTALIREDANQSAVDGTDTILGDYNFTINSTNWLLAPYEPANILHPLYHVAEQNLQTAMSDREFVYNNAGESARSYASLARQGYSQYLSGRNALLTLVADHVQRQNADLMGDAPTGYTVAEVMPALNAMSGLYKAMTAYQEFVRYTLLVRAAGSGSTDVLFGEAMQCANCEELFAVFGMTEGDPMVDSYRLAVQYAAVADKACELAAKINDGRAYYPAATVQSVLDAVFDFDAATIMDIPVAEFPAAAEGGQLATEEMNQAITAHGGIWVEAPSGLLTAVERIFATGTTGGYYVKTAYDVEAVPGFPLNGSFYVDYTPDRYMTSAYTGSLGSYEVPGAPFASGMNASANYLLSDIYCFAVDMLLRTNAIDANLILQTQGVNRIDGSDESYALTEGQGSFIQVDDPDILKAVKVVFADTLTGQIYASAAPDEDGRLYLTGDAAHIVPLEQNRVAAITAWVYLDGALITNSAVDTEVLLDMQVNLQFATDVELIPSGEQVQEATQKS